MKRRSTRQNFHGRRKQDRQDKFIILPILILSLLSSVCHKKWVKSYAIFFELLNKKVGI
jgi:hypothetical protein